MIATNIKAIVIIAAADSIQASRIEDA